MQADGHKEDVDLRWQRWATHMDALILITLTQSGILSQVSSSTLYWLQQRMRERVKLGGADEEKGGWEKQKQQCTKGGRGAWGTQSVRELKREGAIQQRREGTPDWMGPAVPWWSMGQVLGFSHCSESFLYSLCLCISLCTVCSCSYSLALCLMHHLGCVLASALIHPSVLLDSADVAVWICSVYVYAASAWDLCCLQMLLRDEKWGNNGDNLAWFGVTIGLCYSMWV